MPNFTNSGYMAEASDEARLAMARAFHAELSDLVGPTVGGDGHSYSADEINTQLDRVTRDILRLEERTGDIGPRLGYGAHRSP